MDLGLADRVVVVTGATAGIGAAVTRLLVTEGARVVTVSRRPASAGLGEALHIAADLFEAGEPQRAIQLTESEFGVIDALVNNVGYARIRNLEDLTDDDWELAFRANLLSAVRATAAVLPGMVARGSGSIINVASTAGRRPSAKMPDYSVSKAALLAYSRQVAETYARAGVRCNAVVPGPTKTGSWLGEGGLADQQGDRTDVLARAEAARPMGRFAEPTEIAGAIVFLCSGRSSYVTGAEWSVSGGSVP
jgi:3-oxoacyl-[acyl-carrier protein] reductase